MRLSWLLSLPTLLTVVSALAIEKRDADFLSVRTKQHKDMSGKGGDPKNKYFHESVFHPHYDGRFADKQLGYRERRLALSNLIQTYLSTFADIGVETWLMHGTLLGWWWNRKILPWDSDSDVQVSESSIHYLASYYNMSVFHYKTPRIPEGRDYMLEINPHYVDRSQDDKMNVIDARWVDTTSGLFIDITTARYNYTHPAGPGMLSCKDGHEFRDSYIFPLRDTFFEGAPAKIPFAYKELLEAEYKERALTLTEFEGHRFDDQKLEWIPMPKKIDAPKTEAKKPQAKKEEPKKEEPRNKEAKTEEKKVEKQKAEAPKQPQQGQQAQNQQPQQSNQQSQQTDSQKPSSSNPDTKPQGGQPQGQQSPPPPVAKQGTQPMSTEPQKPAIQQKAEDKKAEAEKKKDAKLEKVEADRKAKEQKAAVKAEDRRKDEERRAKKAADESAKKDTTSKQASLPPKPDPKEAEQKKKAEADAAEKKKSQKSEVKVKRSTKQF